MKIFTYFTGTDDAAANRRAAITMVLALSVIIGLFLFGSGMTAHAAEQSDDRQANQTQAARLEEALRENEGLDAQLTELTEALAKAESERDALREQLAAASAEAETLRAELDAVRSAHAVSYVLRFRVERNVSFPQDSEIIYFTRTVDEETYDRWQEGGVVSDSTGFLTVPNDGMLHEWIIILDEKYITANDD